MLCGPVHGLRIDLNRRLVLSEGAHVLKATCFPINEQRHLTRHDRNAVAPISDKSIFWNKAYLSEYFLILDLLEIYKILPHRAPKFKC